MNDALLAVVVVFAVFFDFTNGFHDTANAIATSVGTRAMTPRLAVALAAVRDLFGAFKWVTPGAGNRGFRLGQIASSAWLSFNHGANDAQKTMGVIALALVLHRHGDTAHFSIPTWVKITAGVAIAAGTYVGGWRIIRTLGQRIYSMEPAQGFAAQTAAGATIYLATLKGYPLSTTHVVSGAVMGAGATKRLSAVRWGVAGNIVVAWVLTIPAAALVAAAVYWPVQGVF